MSMSIREFFLNIISTFVGIYIAEDIIMPHFGYLNKKIIETILTERYKGKCVCF